MRRLLLVATIAVLSAGDWTAIFAIEALVSPAPCSPTAELRFEDSPRSRLGDPRRAQKDPAGINPLQVKFIGVTATEHTISILFRTHGSFEQYWDFAEKRKSLGVPMRGDTDSGARRGYVAEFLFFPDARPEKPLRGHVWLDYEKPNSYKAGTQIEEDAGYGAGFGSSAPRPIDNAAP
jgi:hypothetical protein